MLQLGLWWSHRQSHQMNHQQSHWTSHWQTNPLKNHPQEPTMATRQIMKPLITTGDDVRWVLMQHNDYQWRLITMQQWQFKAMSVCVWGGTSLSPYLKVSSLCPKGFLLYLYSHLWYPMPNPPQSSGYQLRRWQIEWTNYTISPHFIPKSWPPCKIQWWFPQCSHDRATLVNKTTFPVSPMSWGNVQIENNTSIKLCKNLKKNHDMSQITQIISSFSPHSQFEPTRTHPTFPYHLNQHRLTHPQTMEIWPT